MEKKRKPTNPVHCRQRRLARTYSGGGNIKSGRHGNRRVVVYNKLDTNNARTKTNPRKEGMVLLLYTARSNHRLFILWARGKIEVCQILTYDIFTQSFLRVIHQTLGQPVPLFGTLDCGREPNFSYPMILHVFMVQWLLLFAIVVGFEGIAPLIKSVRTPRSLRCGRTDVSQEKYFRCPKISIPKLMTGGTQFLEHFSNT